MDLSDMVATWRGLSIEVGRRLGRPIGVGHVRWAVERSGLDVGQKIGGVLVFDESDVETATRLMEEAGRRA